MEEVWKDIKGYEGIYRISNFGNLKSYHSKKGWKQLKLTNKNGWYFTVILCDYEGKRKTTRIHQLVAEHFIGDIPKGYHVHHIDGNRQNNRVDNLEILHPTKHKLETCIEKPEHCKAMIHKNRFERDIKISQYTQEGDWVADYVNASIASAYTGVCSRNICQAMNGQRKQAGGFIWKKTSIKGVVV